MRIEIFTDEDRYNCETCGESYASGGRVLVDGVTIIDRPAAAACYDGDDNSVSDLLILALGSMGHTVLIDPDGCVVTDTKGVGKILDDWEYQAHERDQRDPMRGRILAEAATIRATIADMTRQREEARAEGFAAGLEAAMKVANSLLVRSRFGTGETTEVVYSDFVAAAIGDLAEGAKP